jgi:hypothetical protein
MGEATTAMPRRTGVNAWVVYWEVMPGGPLPIARNNEVVAVLPPRWGDARVREVLERLFLERAATPSELVEWRAGGSPYPPKHLLWMHSVPVGGAGYYCGHNPILIARKVQRLRVLGDDELEWEEISAKHRAAFCRATWGVENCAEAERGPTVTAKRGARSPKGPT